MSFLALLTSWFLVVAGISWEASVLVFLVLAARLLLGQSLPTRWRNALWLLVLARLLLPVLPASPFSIYQIAPRVVTLDAITTPRENAASSLTSTNSVAVANQVPHANDAKWLPAIVHSAAVIWFLGAIAFALLAIGSNFHFARRLRRDQRAPDDAVLPLAGACARELGIRRSFSVLETGVISSPAIFGLWRARLLLPAGLAANLTHDELRLVLLHELAHLRRADLYHHGLVSLLQVVHWFNPMLWLAFGKMREDRELATDALVLSGRRAELKREYGHTLLKLIERAQNHSLPVQLVGILEKPSQLRDRLTRIRQATPGGYLWSRRGLALLCLLGALFLTRAYGDVRTLVIDSKISSQTWNGWGFSSPADKPPALLVPEQFVLTKYAPSPRLFTGNVVVPGAMTDVEVGLVSLVGVHWVNPDAYQWQAVNPDGSFSITDARYLDAPKAIAIRGPDIPWTFLRYNFAPNESGSCIRLHADPSRKITLSVSAPGGADLDHASFELFPAHAQYDDQGRALRRQRLGEFDTGDATHVTIPMPAGQVAVFAHRDGLASYYQIIDTTQAEHFRFVLHAAGRMKITVLDSSGKPLPGIRVNWINPAAPLSISGTSTDKNGMIHQDNLSPGTFSLNADGFPVTNVQIDEGKEADVTLRQQ